jgi:hypothetical protein
MDSSTGRCAGRQAAVDDVVDRLVIRRVVEADAPLALGSSRRRLPGTMAPSDRRMMSGRDRRHRDWGSISRRDSASDGGMPSVAAISRVTSAAPMS